MMYHYLVKNLIRFLVAWATQRGRAVSYTHGGRLYLTRYAIFGWLTGDKPHANRVRGWLPNLYLHQFHAPDLDPACHDHPWPWAVSWIMLGGYTETRIVPCDPTHRPYDSDVELSVIWRLFRRYGDLEDRDLHTRDFKAPAINVLKGDTFHRIDDLFSVHCLSSKPRPSCHEDHKGPHAHSVWTLFLAGPRAHAKPWGYLVQGRGYVPHQTRHEEIEGKEVRW